MAWFDSHAHLTDLEGGADEALVRARTAGVARFVCVGTDLESSRRCLEVAARHPDVWATVGLHPHEASKLAAEWDELDKASRLPREYPGWMLGFQGSYRDDKVSPRRSLT